MKKILKKVENILLAEKTSRLETKQMWFLECSEEQLLANTALESWIKEAFISLRLNGYAVLRENISHELCDSVVSDFNQYCSVNDEAVKYMDEYRLHSRLALFHYQSKSAMDVALNKRTTEIIKAAFRGDFTIVGSLFFEKGSTQDIHRDTPAFFTNPLNHFFGVWNALEDIAAGSGELCYYKGGHLVRPDAALYEDQSVNIDNYFSIVEKACVDAGLELVKFRPEKGDTLIWLPQLPHGGGPRENKSSTRRSMVFHYIPSGIPIHGAGEFFDRTKKIHVNENYSTRTFSGQRVIDMGRTRFYHNYKEGNFDEG